MEEINLLAQINSFVDAGEAYVDALLSYLPFIKFLAALFSMLAGTAIVVLIIRMNLLGLVAREARHTLSGEGLSKKRTVKVWKQIIADLTAGDPTRRKYAIIEADKVLDDILKLSGYKGEGLGERLKQINTGQLANLNDIWAAHKLRNRIAHETDLEVSHEEARRAIQIYETAFKQLKLLD